MTAVELAFYGPRGPSPSHHSIRYERQTATPLNPSNGVRIGEVPHERRALPRASTIVEFADDRCDPVNLRRRNSGEHREA
jgi:hypothetical protein